MRTAALLAPILLTLACGPIVMIPGGEIRGTPRSVPSSWAFTDDVETFVLETRPADPYSVNVWAVAAGGRLYVAAGDAENAWAANIAADPRVRLKVDEDVFELKATAIQDPAERELFLKAVKEKYDFEPDPEQQGKSLLFRLEAR